MRKEQEKQQALLRMGGVISLVFIWGLLSKQLATGPQQYESQPSASAAIESHLIRLHPNGGSLPTDLSTLHITPQETSTVANSPAGIDSFAPADRQPKELERARPKSIVARSAQPTPVQDYLTRTEEVDTKAPPLDGGDDDDLWLIDALNGNEPASSLNSHQDQDSRPSSTNERPPVDSESTNGGTAIEQNDPGFAEDFNNSPALPAEGALSFAPSALEQSASASRNEKPITLWQPNSTPSLPEQDPTPNRIAFAESPPPHEGTGVTEPAAKVPLINGRDVTVFKLADQPKLGNVFQYHAPKMDSRAIEVPPAIHDFDPGPCYGNTFDPAAEMGVYEGKSMSATQRPLIELGKPWYQLGPIPEPKTFLGLHNPVDPQFIVFGDSRIAAAANRNIGDTSTLLAMQTNLFFDLKLTGTERFNVFVSPMTQGANNTRFEFDNDRFVSEANFDFINGFFEGDLGSIWGGLSNKTMPFDLPVAIGIMPLLFQNGVWMEDNILGVAATIPARNIPKWNVTNMDVTFFAGYDNVESLAFDNDAGAARIYGVASFIEAWNGYLELDYAFLDDRNDVNDRSYHNFGAGYSRRIGRFLSHSSRVIVNAGQDTELAPGTADGVLLLSENSLITSSPSNVVPYLNLFAGFDRPQSAARAGAAGGVLRNTGILFESDNLTGYPTLEATANNTFGAALGLNLIASNFGQQLIVESAVLGVMDDPENRVAAGSQYGVGIRYQLPLTNSVLLRADAMQGWLGNSDDINGVRVELRRKF